MLNKQISTLIILIIIIFSNTYTFASNNVIKYPLTYNELKITTAKYKKDGSDFNEFINYLISEAERLKLSSTQLATIKSLKFDSKIIQFDRSQVEYIAKKRQENKNSPKINFTEKYLNNVISEQKINKATKLLLDNNKLLDAISKKYLVPKTTIVGLWGLESHFGTYQGKYNILDSLAILAYEGRRRKLFLSELFNALRIMEVNKFSKNDLQGSWAGAMGQLQFMPSSYLVYGEDYDKNGKIDIWHDKGDVFSSIANYIKSEGWDYKISWGQQVSIPSKFDYQKYAGLQNDKAKSAKEWELLGLKVKSNFSHLQKMWLIVPDGFVENAYLVTSNFKVYLRWNNSIYFALANSIFSEKIMKNLHQLK